VKQYVGARRRGANRRFGKEDPFELIGFEYLSSVRARARSGRENDWRARVSASQAIKGMTRG
jgi:hypothetical protein